MRIKIDTSINLNLYRLLPLALILVPQASGAADRALALYRPQPVVPVQSVTTTQTYLSEGDTVGGYAVTSDYGPRRSPCQGCSSHHTGVDLATPTGTKIIAPKPVEVVCWWDDNGGGNVANISSVESDDTLQLLHLSACVPGTYAPGEVFARTGATGNGTGPHLDARLKSKTEPTKEQIEPYLTGELPAPDAISSAGGAGELTESIRQSEGLKLSAYLDPVGIPTIGYGTTVYPDGRKVKMGDRITREQSEQYLQHDIGLAEKAVAEAIGRELTDNERDALTSFAYNVGAGALKESTLAEKLNAGDKAGAAAEFDRWVHGEDAEVLPGLVTRRAEEKALFLE